MRHHRARYDLLAYAEALVDGNAPVSVTVARHVAQCSVCRAEFEAIRRSLVAAQSLPEPESSSDLTARILQAASQERCRIREANPQSPRYLRTAGWLGFAAGVAAMAAVMFQAALGGPPAPTPSAWATAQSSRVEQRPTEDVRRDATTMLALARAVGDQAEAPASVWELESRRELIAREGDLRAGLLALERNPGCERASRLVHSSIPRQTEALKTLYARQGF